jgi:hypothetical protein
MGAAQESVEVLCGPVGHGPVVTQIVTHLMGADTRRPWKPELDELIRRALHDPLPAAA